MTANTRTDMVWHDATRSYRGITSDGKVVSVSGDEWSEQLKDGIQAFIDNQFPVDEGQDWTGTLDEFEQMYPARYEKYENLTLIEMNSPESWAIQVGQNEYVTFV